MLAGPWIERGREGKGGREKGRGRETERERGGEEGERCNGLYNSVALHTGCNGLHLRYVIALTGGPRAPGAPGAPGFPLFPCDR